MTEQIQRFRLSPQQRYVLLQRRADLLGFSQQAIAIRGGINKGMLREAVAQVTGRHSILRTTFATASSLKTPLQAISEESATDWRDVDLTRMAETDQEAEIDKLARQDAIDTFDLERGPVIRLTLAELSQNEHRLIITLPVVCADAATLNNLFKEIVACYRAVSRGELLSDEPVQYIQFSEWQNELLNEEDNRESIDFWKKMFATPPPVISLPYEKKTEAAETRFAYSSFELTPDELSRIDDLATRYSISAEVVLLTCWMTLLGRLTDEQNILANVLFDGREFEELFETLGLFASFAPVRSQVDPRARLSRVLSVINESFEASRKSQEYFAAKEVQSIASALITEWIGFQFHEQSARGSVDQVSFSITTQRVNYSIAKLNLSCCRASDRLTLEFQYSTDRLDLQSVDQLARQFHTLLSSAIDNPESPVGELAILNDSDLNQLVFKLNDTRAEFPGDMCFQNIFELQVERTPHAIAVEFGDERLSYAALNERANRLASYLRAEGVGQNVPVAILASRTPELIVGLLAIMKAGGYYVPLDPSYPGQRLEFMLNDCSPPVVLTQKSMMAMLEGTASRVICLDDDRENTLRDNPINENDPDDIAYVIYTSGSTGNPKGVAITHRGLVNYLSWAAETYNMCEGSTSPVHSPIGFDLTITSLLLPLIVGGRVLLMPEDQGIEGLSALLRSDEQISLLKITPSHLKLLGQRVPPDAIASRKMAVVVGGENLSGDKIAFWTEHAPEIRIINEYGPTETVVGCCVYEVRASDRGADSIPIGRPIANTELYILDAGLRPQPLGVSGELYIGGVGVAIGYLKRSDLTAERFIPDQFSSRPGQRLYKTGDRARYFMDGNIEFLGRTDYQVKIRGFRIELGEIEETLRRHASIEDAVVIDREDSPGEKRLIAYIKRAQKDSLPVDELRRSLGQSLPEYMIPSAFVTMTSFPLTPNGKVDRRALPPPELVRPELNAAYMAPRTELEKLIARIWQEVLNIANPGLNDNFFDLGGHSILVVEVHNKLQQSLQNEIPLLGLFRFPTIYSLAEYLTKELQAGSQDTEPDLLAEARKRVVGRKRQRSNPAAAPRD